MIDTPSLLIGMLIGFSLAGIIGYIIQQIRLNRNVMQSPDRPMTTVQRTDRTPNQVRAAAFLVAIRFLLWWVALLIAVGGAAFILFGFLT